MRQLFWFTSLLRVGAIALTLSACTNQIPTSPAAQPNEPVQQPSAPASPLPASPQPSPIANSEHSTQSSLAIAPTPTPAAIASQSPKELNASAPATNSGLSTSSGFGSSIGGSFSNIDGALRDLGATVVGNEIRVDLPSDVLFDFDKAEIRPDAAAALDKLLIIINAQAESNAIRIEGHTDAIASDTYNQTLSERRANAVKSWLVDRGVTASRLATRGWGESQPVAPNTNPDGSDNPEGRQKNRRVQVVIETGGGA